MTDREAGAKTPITAEAGRRGSAPLITDARIATSDEMSARIRQYTITMSIRAACFLSMIFVHGIFRWILFAGAVILPLVAVMAANQVNQRFRRRKLTHGMPSDRPELTTGYGDGANGEVIEEEDISQQRP
ncbi:MAG TPA: DUF3099 domain-containing protein, partial [Propionibacteriaceae bacterium]